MSKCSHFEDIPSSTNQPGESTPGPVMIPQQPSGTSVSVLGRTGRENSSVTEEVISSSHSSSSSCVLSSAVPDRRRSSITMVGRPPNVRVNSQERNYQQKSHRSSFGNRQSSFVGSNGSFISTSYEEDGEDSLLDESNQFTSTINEEIHRIGPADEESDGSENLGPAVSGQRSTATGVQLDPVGPSSSVAKPQTHPTNTAQRQTAEGPYFSKYFENGNTDEYLQQFTPYHNTPTTVSDTYSNCTVMQRSCSSFEDKSKDGVSTPGQHKESQTSSANGAETQEKDSAKTLMDIATFPTNKLLNMLTSLLNKIVKSNDQLRNTNVQESAFNDYTSQVLSFRGKHVPAISLDQYFQRIQKYCPTTNDVFLSLLVYFDRIAKRCNINEGGEDGQQLFVMDSYNIHRLIIAAVTVSTKFFSDFFYSNSRYARVGGISLQELNRLELQFLILCDFELIISIEELQRYGDLLSKFWKKEGNT